MFFSTKINIQVQEASPEAIERIEALGGSIQSVYLSKRDLKALLQPHLFIELPQTPQLPTQWTDLKVYVDENKRGYLAPSGEETVSDVVKRIMDLTKPGAKVVSTSANA